MPHQIRISANLVSTLLIVFVVLTGNRLLGQPLDQSALFCGSGLSLGHAYLTGAGDSFFGVPWRKKLRYAGIIFLWFAAALILAAVLGLFD